MKVEIEEKDGHKLIVARPESPYGHADRLTPLEAERLADELRKAARACRGAPAKRLGDY